MSLILKSFWLLCALWVGVANAVLFRYRLRQAVADGAISKREADRFAVATVVWLGGSCLTFWALQQLAESSSPDFLTWVTPYDKVAQAVCFVLWGVSFSWIWLMGGDRKLARIFTLARYQDYVWKHPIAFRIAIVLMIAAGIVGALMRQKSLLPC